MGVSSYYKIYYQFLRTSSIQYVQVWFASQKWLDRLLIGLEQLIDIHREACALTTKTYQCQFVERKIEEMSVLNPVVAVHHPDARLASVQRSVTSSGAKGAFIGSKPSLVACEPMRFLIMDAPRQSNLHIYIKEMKRHNVTDLVRVCERTYEGESELKNAGVQLHEMAYDDGTSPPKEIISQWLDLVHSRFYSKAGK